MNLHATYAAYGAPHLSFGLVAAIVFFALIALLVLMSPRGREAYVASGRELARLRAATPVPLPAARVVTRR